MFEVTPLAMQNLKDHLNQNRIESAIRVTFSSGGCAGPSLSLALDEAKTNDQTHVQDDVTFLIDKDLMEICGGVTIDFENSGCRSGFKVSSTHPVGRSSSSSSGSSCGCSCSSGKCG